MNLCQVVNVSDIAKIYLNIRFIGNMSRKMTSSLYHCQSKAHQFKRSISDIITFLFLFNNSSLYVALVCFRNIIDINTCFPSE